MKVLDKYKKEFEKRKRITMSFEDFLTKAKKDSSCYLSPPERMLKAIGEPELVDTAKDQRLGRLFGNKVIRRYSTFKDFYGLENVIARIVSFFTHAAQGLEESRQILYFLGPVGSAKSSLAERLKALMEQEDIFILADAEGNPSPINESPLGLLNTQDAAELGIPERYLTIIPSPWAVKRYDEYDHDLTKFTVIQTKPDQLRQLAIAKTEPGDDNNQDISALVGKLDIRKLEFYSQNDPDAYNYSGGLCLANQGLLEFVEMFKAPIKVLHPLLTATQEKNYKGTEAISAIPFDGIILAHSNESEWAAFKNNKSNEAFLDRVFIVEVPYNLRVEEETKIYKKLLNTSALEHAPCAPGTLEMLAAFSVLTRLSAPKNSDIISKLKVYNGENIKEQDVNAKSYQEYIDTAPASEGFGGVSTRLAYKILAEVYNFDPLEIAADPVHLLYVLEKTIKKERLADEKEEIYLDFLKSHLAPEYAKQVGKDIQTAYLDSYDEYGQSLFDRYIVFADHWVQDNDYRDPDTGQMFDRRALNNELEKLEKAAGIANPKDFRHEVVNFALRYQAGHQGQNPGWKGYEKLRQVIEHTMFSKTEDLLPVISFQGTGSSGDKKKHKAFVERLVSMGYTERQVRRLCEWHLRVVKS